MSYGNGAIYSALPNLRGLPARRLDKKGTTVITDELIGYDQDANPVCVRDSTTGNPGNRDFTYDARNRLIKASAPNQAWISSEYQYDSLDNIKLARLGTRHYNYTQNALNQLASITQPSTAPNAANYGLSSCADASLTADLGNGSTGPSVAIPSAGTAGTATTGGAQSPKYTFTTDNEGRMTQKGTQAYVYDALNRMTQVTGKETYVYDGHGRRVQITKTSDNKINYPMYSLDGKLLLEDNRQLSKRTEYIYAGGRLVAKKIQPITSAGVDVVGAAATVTYIHTDFLGSPVAETNASGAVDKVERFTPYGEAADLQLDAGPGFTGHATDVATGLTYMQQRYYDAEIGRFVSPDPVGPEEDFINHFNRYNYAQNNPIKNVDPDGRMACNNRGGRESPAVTNCQDQIDKIERPTGPNGPQVAVVLGTGNGRSATKSELNDRADSVVRKVASEEGMAEEINSIDANGAIYYDRRMGTGLQHAYAEAVGDSQIRFSLKAFGYTSLTRDLMKAIAYHELWHTKQCLAGNCDTTYQREWDAYAAELKYIEKHNLQIPLNDYNWIKSRAKSYPELTEKKP